MISESLPSCANLLKPSHAQESTWPHGSQPWSSSGHLVDTTKGVVKGSESLLGEINDFRPTENLLRFTVSHRDNCRPGVSWGWVQAWGRCVLVLGIRTVLSYFSPPPLPSFLPFFLSFFLSFCSFIGHFTNFFLIIYMLSWPLAHQGDILCVNILQQNRPTKHFTKRRLSLSEEFSYQFLLLSPSNIDLNFSLQYFTRSIRM